MGNYSGSAWQVTQTVTFTTATTTTLSLRSLTPTARESKASETLDTSGATDMGTFTLNEANGWQHIFYELPKYSSDGKYKYSYFVQEVTGGYIVDYSNHENGTTTTLNEGEITITNSKPTAVYTTLDIDKRWTDTAADGYRPDLTFNILRTNASGVVESFPITVKQGDTTVTLPEGLGTGVAATIAPYTNEGEGWRISITGLLAEYGSTAYTYTVEEVPVPGYTGEHTVQEDGVTHCFTNTRDVMQLTAAKQWAGETVNGELRPAVTLTLKRYFLHPTMNVVVHDESFSSVQTIASGGESAAWQNLPTHGNVTVTSKAEDGTVTSSATYSNVQFYYYVEETPVPGYSVTYAAGSGAASTSPTGAVIPAVKDAHGAITVTNTATYFTVQKKWFNSDGTVNNDVTQYTISYALYKTGEETPVATGTLSSPDWSYTYTNLDPAATYHVVETGITNGNGSNMSVASLYTVQYSLSGSSWTVADKSASIGPTAGGTTVYIGNKAKPTYILPETGGGGTTLYTGAGALLAGAALALLYKGNKRKRRADA